MVEGNDRDLRVGLPLQAIHDGERWLHEPARLSVVIEAPRVAIEGVLERHPGLRALVDNRWLYLWIMDDEGAIGARYEGGGRWVEADVVTGATKGRADHRIASGTLRSPTPGP